MEVDIDAPTPVQFQVIRRGRIVLDERAVILALLKQDSIVGVMCVFDSRSIDQV
jgi:hypothetical protein